MKRHTEQHRASGLRIRVRIGGRLDAGWSAWFDGLAVTPHVSGDTILHGVVPDQASLHGLLSRIRDLGVPLLRVEVTDAAGDRASDDAAPDLPEAPEPSATQPSGTRPA